VADNRLLRATAATVNGLYPVAAFSGHARRQIQGKRGQHGQAIGSIPSKAIPQVRRAPARAGFVKERASKTETFHEFCNRLRKEESTLKTMLDDLTAVAAPMSMDPELLLQRLGRSARVHHRRHGNRRMRGEVAYVGAVLGSSG